MAVAEVAEAEEVAAHGDRSLLCRPASNHVSRRLESLGPARRDNGVARYQGVNDPRPIWVLTGTTGGLVSTRLCQLAPSTTSVWPEMNRP